jgi:hypothetical protein
MAEVTYFVALPFVAADDGIAAGEPTECFNPVAVVMRAEALSRKPGHIGAVAFSRTGDPASGDFGDAKIIKKFGKVQTISVPCRSVGLCQRTKKQRRRATSLATCPLN